MRAVCVAPVCSVRIVSILVGADVDARIAALGERHRALAEGSQARAARAYAGEQARYLQVFRDRFALGAPPGSPGAQGPDGGDGDGNKAEVRAEVREAFDRYMVGRVTATSREALARRAASVRDVTRTCLREMEASVGMLKRQLAAECAAGAQARLRPHSFSTHFFFTLFHCSEEYLDSR